MPDQDVHFVTIGGRVIAIRDDSGGADRRVSHGNTPAVALEAYIDPHVFQAWRLEH